MKRFFNWTVIRLVLMFALVIFLYSFASSRNYSRKLKKSEVIISNKEQIFVSETMVNKLLIENSSDVKSIAKENLNLNKLEKSVNKQSMIEKSDVFVTVDGVLKTVVKQKTPIARVFKDFNSYYIDSKGTKMPLSELTAARVLLVSGNVSDENLSQITKVAKYIYEDDFLKKNIIGMNVSTSNAIILKNRNFNFEIDFGKVTNIEKKFNNYKAFFQKTAEDSTLYKYKKINLKFTQQVVCIK